MLRNKLIYILVMTITAAVSVFFNVKSARLIFGFEIAMIPILILYVVFEKKNLEAEIRVPYFHTRKESDFNIEVCINNRGFLPVTECRIKIICQDAFTGRKYVMGESAALDSKSNAVLVFNIRAKYCGKYTVRLDKINVFDPLHIFSLKVKTDSGADEFMVLPRLCRIFIGGSASSRLRHEWEQYSHTASGEDTSEVFDVHEYRHGDTLSRVHWKLTAKTGEYLVKEYSLPVENMIFLFADLRLNKERGMDRKQLDGFFEILASVSWSLSWEGISHVVIWYDSESRSTMIVHIEYEKDVYEMIGKVFSSSLYTDDIDIRNMYMTEHEREIRTDNSLLINTSGEVLWGETCVKVFDLNDAQRLLMEWKLEI